MESEDSGETRLVSPDDWSPLLSGRMAIGRIISRIGLVPIPLIVFSFGCITRKRLDFRLQYKHENCRLESRLQISYIFSVEILPSLIVMRIKLTSTSSQRELAGQW